MLIIKHYSTSYVAAFLPNIKATVKLFSDEKNLPPVSSSFFPLFFPSRSKMQHQSDGGLSSLILLPSQTIRASICSLNNFFLARENDLRLGVGEGPHWLTGEAGGSLVCTHGLLNGLKPEVTLVHRHVKGADDACRCRLVTDLSVSVRAVCLCFYQHSDFFFFANSVIVIPL